MYHWQNKSILIVDDISMNQLLLKHILQQTKVNLFYAINSIQFFKIIDKYYFDLILMDINLNESLNGIDLIKYLQSNEYNIPIIIQSANDCDVFDIVVDDCIQKPIDSIVLLDKINKIFETYRYM